MARRKKRPVRPLEKLTKAELKRLVNKENMGDAAIGKKYGVSRQAVAQRRWKMGVVARTSRNEARNVKIVNAYAKGIPGTKIAEKFGLSVSQTYRILNEE